MKVEEQQEILTKLRDGIKPELLGELDKLRDDYVAMDATKTELTNANEKLTNDNKYLQEVNNSLWLKTNVKNTTLNVDTNINTNIEPSQPTQPKRTFEGLLSKQMEG